MFFIFNFFLIIIFLFSISCSKKDEQVTILNENNLELQMIEVYNQADEFEKEM